MKFISEKEIKEITAKADKDEYIVHQDIEFEPGDDYIHIEAYYQVVDPEVDEAELLYGFLYSNRGAKSDSDCHVVTHLEPEDIEDLAKKIDLFKALEDYAKNAQESWRQDEVIKAQEKEDAMMGAYEDECESRGDEVRDGGKYRPPPRMPKGYNSWRRR